MQHDNRGDSGEAPGEKELLSQKSGYYKPGKTILQWKTMGKNTQLYSSWH
jgi:hypothetical protein